jgi:predicted phage terminase large subunit-like protein
VSENPCDARRVLRSEVYRAARSNLIDYMQLLHGEVGPAQSFELFRHTRALAQAFEHVARGKIKRLLVAVPPRFGKSLVGSIALPTWLLGSDPSLRIICASYGDELARDFALKSRLAMQSPLYERLFPKTRLAADGMALNRLTTTQGGYRYSTSVGGAVTGKGADLIIVDDPLKAKDAIYSQPARDEAYHWITGTLASRFDKPADGRMIVLAQRLHTDDLIARLRDDGGWTMVSIPAEAQQAMELDLGDDEIWKLAPGDLLFPERFEAKALDLLRHDLGEANYAAQILQNPQALGGTIFKIKDFGVQPCATFKAGKMERVFQSWDTAISEENHAAYSVCTTWGVFGKYFALMDVFREKLTYPALLKAALAQFDRFKPAAAFIEKASSGHSLLRDLHARRETWAYPIKPLGSKTERAMQQAAKIEQGRVLLPGKAPWFDTFINEVAVFPLGRTDQVDSMTQFLRVFDTGRNHPLFRELRFWRDQA